MREQKQKERPTAVSGPGRQANLELLRCVAMLMVVVMHYLGKGNLLAGPEKMPFSPAETAAWLLECLCVVAVNLYMLISGYFLCVSPFRPSRLFRLWLQVWMYSVCFGLAGALTGIMRETDFDIHFLLTIFFPVSMNHYWFMTAYVFLYVLLPFVGAGIRRMTKRQLGTAAILLLLVFSLPKSLLPVRFETDGRGYDCLWYLCVFVSAAYVRRFGIPFLEKKGRGIALYLTGSLLVFGGAMGLRLIYQRTGRLGRMQGMFLEYNHILPFLAAVGLFFAFRRLKLSGRFGAAVVKIAPYTLGVYLLHENLGFRYSWQSWLGADDLLAASARPRGSLAAGLWFAVWFLLWVMVASACVFAVGILVDRLRELLVRGLDQGLCRLAPYRRLRERAARLDDCFREKAGADFVESKQAEHSAGNESGHD